MHTRGFFAGWGTAAAAVLAVAVWGHGNPAEAAIPATSCTDLNGSTLVGLTGGAPATQFTAAGSSFVAGQRITATATTTPAATVTVSGAVAAAAVGSVTFTVPSSGALVESVAVSLDSSVSFTCTGGGSTGNIQPTLNAQIGVFNGQQTLQSFNDWLSKTIVASFNLGRRPAQSAAERLGALSAQATLRKLRADEQGLVEELADLQAGRGLHGDAAGIERRLADVRQRLVYARAAVRLGPAPEGASRPVEQASSTAEYSLAPEMSFGAMRLSDKAPQISIGTRDLQEICDPGDATIFGQPWNVWLEGRFVGAADSVQQSNVFGFNGSGGVDYKLQPWLALGLSVGAESYETKFGTSGVRAGTVGLSVMPYVGVRLSDNVTASAFTGLTHINYNTNPASNITAQFESLRLMLGGTLTGVWREENWRFQPSVAGTFGSETQNAYVDSQGSAIAAQTLYYGRVSAGPEVGYTFADPGWNWTIEPFVTARFNVDSSSSPVTVVNGSAVILRAGTQASGAMGAGAEMRFPAGFYFRAQGAYESIGVIGLDVWTALVRGGMAF